MARAQTRCGGISYSERGTCFPLVLLHASLCDRRDFDPIVPDLAERHRVIAVDWPWHGESDCPPPPLKAGAGLFADVLEDFTKALALPPAAFIGSSVGGCAAARLAITHPERVAGLVLVNSGGFIPVNLLTRAFCMLMGTRALTRVLMPPFIRLTMSPATDDDRDVVRRAAARAHTAGGMRTGAALWRSFARPEHDLRPRAAQLRAPTLIVWGAKDIGLPLRAGRTTHAAIAGSRLEVLDTGHMPFSSDPRAFLSLVMPFIDLVSRHDT
jgi:pimeloyl-ACP methyl ester carboxylesterase